MQSDMIACMMQLWQLAVLDLQRTLLDLVLVGWSTLVPAVQLCSCVAHP
eukprot:COSAG01_NODE_6701_length_3537_cov_52.677138_2_plen_49_part_00